MNAPRAVTGLALCGDFTDAARWAELLQATPARATLFPTPVALLDAPEIWKSLLRAGFELGIGTLLDAALPDGRLPLWTPEMIAGALDDADQLLNQEFGVCKCIVAMPIGSPRCLDDGEFLSRIGRRRVMIEPPWVQEALSGGHRVIGALDITHFDAGTLNAWLSQASGEAARIEVGKASAEFLTAILTTPATHWQSLATLPFAHSQQKRPGHNCPGRCKSSD